MENAETILCCLVKLKHKLPKQINKLLRPAHLQDSLKFKERTLRHHWEEIPWIYCHLLQVPWDICMWKQLPVHI